MERDTRVRGDGDRRGAESPPVSRRVLLAAEDDARAHDARMQPRPAAHGAAGRASPGHAARPPRYEQPRLPYGEPMHTAEDGPKVIALTIDAGPGPVYTPQILRILRRYGITASFSVTGRNAAAFPGAAREVAAAGHMTVSHTWNHCNLRYMPAVAVRAEISRATDAIHAATGERPGMFRAPCRVWPPAAFSYCGPRDWPP